MKLTPNRLALAIASAGLLTIYGCGGGGGGGSVVTGPQITGTAATGAALANAPVVITNNANLSPCTETSITTSALGSYTCTLKSGEAAPFFIVITDPTGDKAPLVSIATTTPAAGTPLTVNVTPLTTAIVAQLNGGDALDFVNNKKSTYIKATLDNATTNVLAQLAPVLTAISAPAGYHPFTTNITAASAAGAGNTADQVLDIVKVGINPGTGDLALSTITDPAPVKLADATTTTVLPLPIPIPSLSASDLGSVLSTSAAAFNTCFADAPAVRALATNPNNPALLGGPEVTSVSAACQLIATDGTTPSGKPAFLSSGFTAGQFFYSMLIDPAMTRAKFSAPEVMAFYPANATATNINEQVDRAVLNIRYVDNAGNPGNVITVAANYPGTGVKYARPTNWWLVGNQQDVAVGVQAIIRRVEQFNPANTTNPSNFFNAIVFNISTTGPNSGLYNAAQVTGPGLPTTGLWYFKNPLSNQAFMDLSNYRPATSTPNAGTNGTPAGCISNCPVYVFARTSGVTSTSRGLVANPVSLSWAQGTDGSYNVTSGIRPKNGDAYTIKLYNGTSLFRTVTKHLLSNPIDPSVGYLLPWNAPGVLTLSALNPLNSGTNGALTALTLDWIQNPTAQQVSGVIGSTTNGTSTSPIVSKGATSVTISAGLPNPFTDILPANIPTPTSISGRRTLNFSYRMLDGSSKSTQYMYN